MTLVEFSAEDVDAVRAGRTALAMQLNFDTAVLLYDLLIRMKRAREHEIAAALVEEMDERRGRLKVVD